MLQYESKWGSVKMDNRKKILLVDDDQVSLTLLENILSDEFETVSCRSGEEALEVIADEKPDIVILDITMPGMDGYEVCRVLKSDDLTKSIPVIFVTVSGNESDETKGFEVGAADFISKPYSRSVLRSRVKTHLEIKEMLEKYKRQANRVNNLNSALKELDNLKKRFLGVAAHDLWNPLLSIRSMSQTMTMSDLEKEERGKFFDAIYKSSNRMLKVVTDLLDISAIEESVFDILLSNGSLSQIVLERVELAEVIAKRYGVSLVTKFEEMPESVFDKRRIEQVIDNLLNNAIKCSEPGEVVTISTQLNGDNLEVTVSDQGPGLPDNLTEKLEEETPQGRYKLIEDDDMGTGLGLYIAMQVVHAHGGQIRVESKAGVSSAFTVTLPKSPTERAEPTK